MKLRSQRLHSCRQLHLVEGNRCWTTLHNSNATAFFSLGRVRLTKSEVARKWAQWLHKPCRFGGPLCFIAGDKISSGPKVGPVAI